MDCEPASKSPADSRPVIDSKKSGRSRISNGSVLLPGVDGRSAWVRRCRDVIAAHLSDLGGLDNCSAAEHSIVRRAAVLTTELEVLEVRFAKSGEASSLDLETYQRCANSLRRLLEAVGLQRRSRDLNPKLDDLLLEHAQRAAAAVHTDEAEVIDG